MGMAQQMGALRRPKVFYGWVIVAVGFVAQVITGISFQALATYLVPLQTEFGWTRAQLGAARSITQAENALLGPVDGFLVDRLGPRVMMALGVFLFGLALVLFGFIHSLWAYYSVNILMAVGTALSGLLVISTAINHWFRRNRTLAIALATTGLGASGVILIPLIVWGQNEFGWRWAAIGSGIGVWAIGIPAALLLRQSPERYGLLPDGDTAGAETHRDQVQAALRGTGKPLINFTLSEAMHTPTFWFISMANAFQMTAMSAFTVYQFAHMEQGMGLARSSAAFVITVMSGFNIGGRLLGGVLGDRLPKNYLLAGSMLGTAISLVTFALTRSLMLAMVSGSLYGLCWGIRTPVLNSLRGDYFGRTAFGRISGMSAVFSSPLAILGPVLIGLLADRQGDYRMALSLLGLLCVATFFLFVIARRPAVPARLRTQATG